MTWKILIRNKATSEGKLPLVLRITANRKVKTIQLDLVNPATKWNKAKGRFLNNKAGNLWLEKLEKRITDIILESKVNGNSLSLEEFERLFKGESRLTTNAIEFFNMLQKEQENSYKMSNAKAYKDTIKALKDFGGETILFEEITPDYLYKWEVFLRSKRNSNGGIAFKMRELRAMINKAIERRIIDVSSYPFKEYKISKLKLNPQKRALSQEEFNRFKEVDLSNYPPLKEAHDYFMFSFYTRGMNFIDMMLLKKSNINNNRIYYKRSKTGKSFNIEVLEPVKKILDKYEQNLLESPYVFPILLKENMTPRQIQNRRHKVLSRYNRKLKDIGELADIKGVITSYVARHTFATLLKRNQVSVEVISEMMGHHSPEITMTYLKEFDNEVLDKEAIKLLDI